MNIPRLITQKSYERVEHVLRRHPVTFVPKIFQILILLGIPVLAYMIFERLLPTFFNAPGWFALLVIGGMIYYLSIYLLFFTYFVDYYHDLWIVTNDRLLDIEQQGLLSRTITELDLFQIQDITTEIHGFMPTIFHYGNLKVKTASSNQDIIFREIHNPNKIRERLLILSHEDRKYHQVEPGHMQHGVVH